MYQIVLILVSLVTAEKNKQPTESKTKAGWLAFVLFYDTSVQVLIWNFDIYMKVLGEQWMCRDVCEYVQNSNSRFLHQWIWASINYDTEYDFPATIFIICAQAVIFWKKVMYLHVWLQILKIWAVKWCMAKFHRHLKRIQWPNNHVSQIYVSLLPDGLPLLIDLIGWVSVN